MIARALRYFASIHRMKTDPIGYARRLGVQIGEGCRVLGMSGATFGSEPYLITIGNHVTVTGGVRFITHDGGVWIFRDRHPDIDRIAPIRVGNNVFIGVESIILPGVVVEDNSIIAAGSVVTKRVATGTIVGGVPARVIGTLDEYWEKHQHEFLHVRSMPRSEKEAFFREKFRSNESP